jgi:P4 family phage/plasmid primase-like protien
MEQRTYIEDHEISLFLLNFIKDLDIYIEFLKKANTEQKLLEYERDDICEILIRYPEKSHEINHFINNTNTSYRSSKHYNSNLTFRTIIWYVRKKLIDDKEYQEFEKFCIKKLIENIISNNFTETNILEYFFFFLFLEFVHDPINKELYFYSENEHRWKKDENNVVLYKRVGLCSFQLSRILQEYNEKFQEENPENKHFPKILSKNIKKILSLSFQNSIIKNLLNYFSILNLSDLLDSNPALTGTINGVIEIRENKPIFREGKPEDYITNSTKIPFIISSGVEREISNSKEMKKLNSWLEKVFMDPEIEDYFLRVCSSLLFRRNREKLLYILTGTGDNSKSAIKRLIELTFGDYCFTLPNTVFAKKDKQGPRVELSCARNKSVCFIQENDASDVLISGKIKELTGNDVIYTRQLYEKGKNCPVSFKCFFMCNQVPLFTSFDKALRRRIVIIPFESIWVINPPEDKMEQREKRIFKLKTNFEEKIPDMAPYFLRKLFDYFSEYIKNPLEPQMNSAIKQKISKFWKENDPYLIFKEKYIRKQEGEKLDIETLSRCFSEWFRETFSRDMKRIPNQTIIKYNFQQVLEVNCIDGFFEGYKCLYSNEIYDTVK